MYETIFQIPFPIISPVLFWLLFSAFITDPLVPAVYAEGSLFGDYLKTPVFFELFWEDYYDSTNFDLMPDGKIYIYPLGIRDLSEFTWADSLVTNGARDYSWFLR